MDRRKQVLFTEQLALQNAYSSRGAGMDYRRIADTLDVLTHEGGLRFGNSAARQTGNVMEDAACAENRAYLYVSDLFDALAVPRGKAVMNDEYYCARFDFGKRVPSRRLDMVFRDVERTLSRLLRRTSLLLGQKGLGVQGYGRRQTKRHQRRLQGRTAI